jgi:hypothetical protein
MTLERAASLIPFLVILVIPAWSVWRLVRGLRAGDWKRPGWFGHAAWASFFVTVVVWLRGLFSGGLDSEQACVDWHHQPFDSAYREAHRADWFRLFPLSNRCNAGYDLVPAWVNPTVAVFVLLFVVSVAGLGWTAALRLRETSKEKGRRS